MGMEKKSKTDMYNPVYPILAYTHAYRDIGVFMHDMMAISRETYERL
jgi:hypothetical protein